MPGEKVVDYLLSFIHKDGLAKAEFFTRFGFQVEKREVFAEAVINHARTREVGKKEVSPFGMRYIMAL